MACQRSQRREKLIPRSGIFSRPAVGSGVALAVVLAAVVTRITFSNTAECQPPYRFGSLSLEETIRRFVDPRLDPTERRPRSYRMVDTGGIDCSKRC
jgi:hypothetical protein